VLLEWASAETRILVTIDTDFGELIFGQERRHAGLVRLPDVPAAQRIDLMAQVLARYQNELENGAIITVRGERIRITKSSAS
jgi:predicted nuclease of predicted toxin-antitoxin system